MATDKDFIVCLVDGSKFVSSTDDGIKTRASVSSAVWLPYDEAVAISSYLRATSKKKNWQALPANYVLRRFRKQK